MRRSPLARSLTAVVAVALVGGALTACSGGAFGGGCDPEIQPGDASAAVSASGEVGATPAVEFPTPLISDDLQRSVVTTGTGEPAQPGATVLYDYVYYDGSTGDAITSANGELGAADDLKLAFGEALACATPGSRIVLTGPVGEIDARGQDATDTIVAVIDVRNVFLGKANGFNQLPEDGMPQVVTAVDGEPGITLTYQAAPTEPRSAVIKAGSGATLADGDTVIAHVRSWTWPAGVGGSATLGSDTWATGTPTTIDLSTEVITDKTVYGALEGSKVGSQLLVVIPKDDDSGTATVFVIDVLGILPQD